MTELKERMQILDLVEPPQIWSRVGVRSPSVPPEPRVRRVAAVVLVLIAIAVAVLVRLSYRDSISEPIRPGPKPNGPIFFLGHPDGPAVRNDGLYIVDTAGSSFRTIAPPGSMGQVGGFSVSPDLQRIVFANASDVLVMNLNDLGVRTLTRDEPREFRPREPQDWWPAWSPDGKLIAFGSDRCCKSNGLVKAALEVMRPDGSGRRLVTDGTLSVWQPQWSPDGSEIAFTSLADDRNTWLVNVDGTNLRRLIQSDRSTYAFSWAPDGEAIAYASRGLHFEDSGPPGSKPEDFQIRVVNRDGTGERIVYACADICRFGGRDVAWSPDGKEIAFIFGRVRGRGIAWHVAIVTTDGTGFRVLNTQGIQPSGLAWVAAVD